MTEFGFEVSLCAALETTQQGIVARQLGGGVTRPGGRILDIVVVGPGPQFDRRTALTPSRVPDWLIDAPVGPGRFRPADAVLDGDPEHRADRIEQATDLGLIEQRRQHGKLMIKQTARYPGDWFGPILGIENKPDLGQPGALTSQTRFDVSLSLLDYAVVATESHVTRAHLNRLPDPVGVWEYTPGEEITVIRQPKQLSVTEYGIELTGANSDHTLIESVSPAEKATARRRLAERAYGKGWRTYSMPSCKQCQLTAQHGTRTLPYCTAFERIINPATECGPDCPAFQEGEPPSAEFEAEREQRTGWTRQGGTTTRQQAGLDQFQ